MHATAQALLDAQLDFIQAQLQQPETITEEVLGFFAWFKQQSIGSIWSTQLINDLLQKQVLLTPVTEHLLSQIEQHIQLVLNHPINEDTAIEDIFPVDSIDKLAKYIADKTEYRHKLIQNVVTNPAYIELISNIIQQSIKDYMENAIGKKLGGVGSIMKMGKSVLERATDTNLDDTLKHYLNKNISKISTMSEKIINQKFDDDTLYHLQAKIWHKIKKQPISSLKSYLNLDDLSQTVELGHQVWEHLRQTPYLQAQVASNIETWLKNNTDKTFETVLQDINIDENLLRHELYQLVMPIISQLVQGDYLMQRIKLHLTAFYQSPAVTQILTHK